MPKPRPTLSRRERQVMDVLYQRTEATVAEVLEALADPPTYSAVRSILRVLEEKGHITHREDGPRYVYLPAVEREQAQQQAVDHLVHTFFEGSTDLALAALLSRDDLSLPEAQAKRLARAIEHARAEGR